VSRFPLVPLGHDPDISVADLKALVRSRDGHRCFLCGMSHEEHVAAFGVSLHVHRLNPGRRYTLAGSVALCQTCHAVQPKSPSPARHKRGFFVFRIPTVLRDQLEELCARNLTTLSGEVVAALRKHLAENGLWPPPPP
jgi:hypothetical protein